MGVTVNRRTFGKMAALGLGGAWGSKPMSIYGRNSASGTYGYFKNIGNSEKLL